MKWRIGSVTPPHFTAQPCNVFIWIASLNLHQPYDCPHPNGIILKVISNIIIYWIVIYIVKYKNTFMSEQGNIPILQRIVEPCNHFTLSLTAWYPRLAKVSAINTLKHHLDDFMQDYFISSGLKWRYCSLALSHQSINLGQTFQILCDLLNKWHPQSNATP